MEKTDKAPKPLDEKEKLFLEDISKNIKEAAQNQDAETAHKLRRQLIDAAENGIISVSDAINAAFTPYFKNREEE